MGAHLNFLGSAHGGGGDELEAVHAVHLFPGQHLDVAVRHLRLPPQVPLAGHAVLQRLYQQKSIPHVLIITIYYDQLDVNM